MKNLRESLLDDDEKLFNDTSTQKGFPKESDIKFFKIRDYERFYYKYKNDIVANSCLKKIDDSYKVIYTQWYKANDCCVIMLFLSKSTMEHASLLGNFMDCTTHTLKDAQKLSYELLTNIKDNPGIINFIYDYPIPKNNPWKKINIDIIKKEFKDTWQKVK